MLTNFYRSQSSLKSLTMLLVSWIFLSCDATTLELWNVDAMYEEGSMVEKVTTELLDVDAEGWVWLLWAEKRSMWEEVVDEGDGEAYSPEDVAMEKGLCRAYKLLCSSL